jgi:hypothetical protein
MSKREAELAAQTKVLPDAYAGRIPAADLADLRSMAGGGEWDELLELLVAVLHSNRVPVSIAEIDDLREVLSGWGLPTDALAGLIVHE